MGELEDLRRRVAELEQRLHTVQTQAETVEREAALQMARALDLNARLSVILSLSAALPNSRDVDTVVRLIIRETATLFPGTSATHFFLVDHERNTLVLRASDKPNMLITHPMQGLAGKAILSPRAMLLVGPELELALNDLEPEHLAELRHSMREWPPQSALIAPLRVDSQRFGAIVLYGGVHAHLYHPRDIPFIQALADLAAVSIDELNQRTRAAALQRDLALTQSLHAEAEARLNTAQAQLLQSAKLAAVGELSASVAHEINNPLYAARNSLYLVEQDLAADDPQRAFLTIAQQELGRIARIITRMRDFYRPTRAELASTSINVLLRETLELVQTHLRHSHINAVTELGSDIPAIIAHADQLRQVFLNIILNACDAMPDGGDLRVRTRMLQARHEAPTTIEIDICDTGAGIPPEHLPHLFEPFYTTKTHGTGLGLAISAHIISQHNGRILVESEVCQGSTFSILLPTNLST
ncbi:GAF sensor signal transduction histidine kinase [Oscillochloris trichoides DG-6]|uniref:histidine kinase n=1 Tax=Oscillochloris trichoides DG-6 TaxID=765420 RepID=E1IIJ6_9CHLR|nr:ATP-binding protein [Oscillochloris trichoides]EFO78986.1 GAF sensor signal transduction histidine kinase [Oscillochloris trichoides DG-6]